jgi:hypothetical protein
MLVYSNLTNIFEWVVIDRSEMKVFQYLADIFFFNIYLEIKYVES